MSESTDISSEQEQELRRRNINLESGDFSEKIKTAAILKDPERDEGNDNETMDSDHVSGYISL